MKAADSAEHYILVESVSNRLKNEIEIIADMHGIIDEKTIEHIFCGVIKKKESMGFHSEAVIESPGKIIRGTCSTDALDEVYKAKVSVYGIEKRSNNGLSTFFPRSMSPQDVVNSITEAYKKREYTGSRNIYRGRAKNGLIIDMYIDEKTGRIITAFPVEK